MGSVKQAPGRGDSGIAIQGGNSPFHRGEKRMLAISGGFPLWLGHPIHPRDGWIRIVGSLSSYRHGLAPQSLLVKQLKEPDVVYLKGRYVLDW